MPNGGLPNSHLKCKQPIALWQCWRGKGLLKEEFTRLFPWFAASAPGLKLPPILHRRQPLWAWSQYTVPSAKVAFQSCPFWRQVMQSIATTSIRFLWIAVIPFIHPHHGYEGYWLWMDLASAHYAKDILVFLQQQSIHFIPKDANPPCVA